MNPGNNEQLPVQVINKVLRGKNDIRIALAVHPVSKEVAPSVPLNDYADAFSYSRNAIQQMVERTKFLKKHSCTNVMLDHLGRFQTHICIFEEAMLGLFLKLQPQRCKDPDIASHIDEVQEELIKVLKDALKGYSTKKSETDAEFARYKLLSQKAKDQIGMIKQIETMSESIYKDRAIEVFEKFTGKELPKSRQIELFDK